MLRGLVFGVAMIVVRLFQGTLINVWQTQAAIISIVLVVLFLIGVILWGISDGRADAADNPDPDRRSDLAMTWLLGGLVAGFLSGAVTWLIGVFYKALYVGGLINELTVFAAFTALLVFIGGIGGVTLGRYLIDRKGAYNQQRTGGDEDRADTDVFAAVRSDEATTAEGGEWQQEHSSAVATAEREGHDGEEGYREDPAYSQEKTSQLHTPHDAERTEEVPTTKADTERTEPNAKREGS